MTALKNLENRTLLSRYTVATSYNLSQRPEEAELVKEIYGSVEAWIDEKYELEAEILKRMQ